MNQSSQSRTSVPHPSPLVLIVILNWNNPEETQTAVTSAMRLDYPNFRLLIVDNGSEDDSLRQLRPLVSERIELIESPINTGYTGGCNLGLERALALGAKYAWLLNNDAVVEPKTLSSLVNLAESDDRIGLATPRIAALNDDHFTFTGGVVSIKDRLYQDTDDPEDAEEWAVKYPDAGLVIGTAMLVRMDLARKIGLLDQSFFAYFEDTDYSIRSSQAGFRNVVDRTSIVRHFDKNHTKTPLEIRPHYWYYMARNERRLWRKHLGLAKSFRLSWQSFNIFLRHRNGLDNKSESSEAILAGLWDGWLGRGGPYRPGVRMPALAAAAVKLYSRRSALKPRVNTVGGREALSA
jgi:GT2 family glycosyltransferase